MNIHEYERKEYSQHGEDGALLEIVRRLPDIPRWFVEVGCGDGSENNTRCLLDRGWQGMWIDADARNTVKAREINPLTETLLVGVETKICPAVAGTGVFSLDIDGNDYWVWKSLGPQLNPWVCIIECQIQKSGWWVMPYFERYAWDHVTHNCGGTVEAMEALGREMGYTSLGVLTEGPNMFLVRNDIAERLSG